MSQPNFDQNNPYQAPPSAAPVVAAPTGNFQLRKLLYDFQSQIVALGAFWIIIGGVAAAIGLFASGLVTSENGTNMLLGLVVIAIGIAWVVLGILSCLKQMWAVYVALALSYLSLLGNLVNLNLCGSVIVIVVIIQAHRVLGWAGKLSQAGIPLTARPDQIAQG